MTPSAGIWIAWSGGKDSALTLLRLRQQGMPVAGLVSTVVGNPPIVAFHGIPVPTLSQQAQALGLPLQLLRFRQQPSNELYARRLRAFLHNLGCRAIAFGDIFLEDVRRYREQILAPLAVELLFPLWGEPSAILAREAIRVGIHAVLTCVDSRCVDPWWLGRPYVLALLDSLLPSVDPCGERGEFHTCVLSMPGFRFSLSLASWKPTVWAEHWHGWLVRTELAPS
ncbi:MAG: adenine nucleotide alpha hydrolase [Candidatus Kapabacteria bacterium]|nr:adenine nucleotide alpha hydrolase [Candidatus Kapabacteria bacterium]